MTVAGWNEPGQVGLRVESALAQATYATEDEYRKAKELARQAGVVKRRAYYDGEQLDEINNECLRQLATDQSHTGEKMVARYIKNERVPEHLRELAYSTQIEESVDYLTQLLVADFDVEAEDPTVNSILKACLDSSPELSGTSEDDEVSVVNVTREALLAMDCPVRVRFDRTTGSCWLEFWPSDAVRMDYTRERSDYPEYVALWETYWLPSDAGGMRQVKIRREWRVEWYTYAGPEDLPGNPAIGPMTWQCVERWYEERPGSEDKLLAAYPTGVPFVPWALLRGSRKGLRIERGESIVTNRAMALADRYDALEGYGWKATRHNSHATVAVIGDAAMMQKATVIHKDIADALTFPGGTELVALTLPTDPSMIEHQRTVILDAIYGTFGLARVDQSTLQGLGQVTGYALEILNTRTESTFGVLRTQFIRDWLALLNLVLDCHAHWSYLTRPETDGALPPAQSLVNIVDSLTKVDPRAIYPNRTIEIRTGSGGVVDVAQIRDNYVAGILPLEEVWRRLGYSDDEIKQLRREIDEETQRKREAERIDAGVEGGQFGGAPRPELGVVGGSTTPPGTPGGVVNRPREPRRRR